MDALSRLVSGILALMLLQSCTASGTRPANASLENTPPVPTTTAAPPACNASEYREFDFWIGEWTVVTRDDKPAGNSLITLSSDRCAVIENWQTLNGARGISMNYYDPRLQQWRQHWVGLGVVLDMSGSLKDGAMVLEGPMHYLKDGRETLLRGTWTRLPDGRIRQHFVESADGGKTWAEWFDGYYARRPGQSTAAAGDQERSIVEELEEIEPVVCRRVRVTGSRVRREEVCLTRSQWDAERNRAKDEWRSGERGRATQGKDPRGGSSASN